MRQALASGRQAMLLVPEIALTEQLVQRLSLRFSDVAISHSGLTETQRAAVWRDVVSGKKRVVIGTRSAVFAPCPALGLIVVDEEQEGSYKNLRAPRFHVRDVAILRGKLLNIPVLLGSATPSLEVWHRSGTHRDYHRLTLSRRVRELPMPSVQLVDMRDEEPDEGHAPVLSRRMISSLKETLKHGEQALLLVNRRGFATAIYCAHCRTRIECPACNVSLVVHTASGASICHYCRTRIPTPTTCPNATCGAQLVHLGSGTQRIETTLASIFPDTRIKRVDSDTMTHRREYQKVIGDVTAGRIDLLVGTQMLAKGLDFPGISFVGVVHADIGGVAADFRAHERLFQLITQVAGRAGRADRPGRVIVQTTMPELTALQCAMAHDYPTFADQEIAVRNRVNLPPFSRLARLVLAEARESLVRQRAEDMARRFKELMTTESIMEAEVLGPHPCSHRRLRGKYRYDMLIRANDAGTLQRTMQAAAANGLLQGGAVSLIVDVDPVSLT